MLVAIGPGNELTTAYSPMNSSSLIHWFVRTASERTKGIIDGPPPKPNAPILTNARVSRQTRWVTSPRLWGRGTDGPDRPAELLTGRALDNTQQPMGRSRTGSSRRFERMVCMCSRPTHPGWYAYMCPTPTIHTQ